LFAKAFWHHAEKLEPGRPWLAATREFDDDDVAAAHVNPLAHFLQFGIHEGRSSFADGVWG